MTMTVLMFSVPILVLAISVFSFVLTIRTNYRIKKTNKRIAENNSRINLLSIENGKLYEENIYLKEKLKNLGFNIDIDKWLKKL